MKKRSNSLWKYLYFYSSTWFVYFVHHW